jgi:3-hydroxyacyl-CoA dehydrogenase/enoyl-CoA hydratase/3-hydroxybutyryl-CoA epimerase
VWKKAEHGKLEKDRRNPRAATAQGEVKVPDGKIVDRCVLAMLNESARALEEGVVSGPGPLDLAVVFGTGFAPFRGGVLAYADARGPAEIVERLKTLRDELAAEPQGARRLARFEPAPLLAELAKKGGRFHA